MHDEIDIRIMRALAEDGRMSISDLADKIGLSQTPTAKRVRRLEESGLITGYQAQLSEALLGGALTVFTWVSLVDQKRESLTVFEHSMAASPEVMDCYLMTGDADYLLRIAVDNLEEFERFLTERVSSSDKVSSIRSSFALRPVALKRRPPLLSR
ncbi:MAG: Lrp/AsnC family transcriptional regulator [Pseudomonadota bacterium]